MSRLSKTEVGIEWVKQFSVDEQSLAVKLLDELTLVGHDEFIDGLRQRIIDKTNKVPGMVALYAEREIRRGKNRVPNRLYKEPYRKKNRRAYGGGPQPVLPTKNYDLKVGSEGIISWLISELCTEFPKKFICHPSPKQIRTKKVRKFILVTDLIGTGNRAFEYFESAWRVASVKSWKSLKLWSFGVIAYSGSDLGIKRVMSHKCKPTVDLVKPCPTITSEFDLPLSISIKNLCINYDPIDHDSKESLGYKGSGALIVFSHGCPNNCPRILHKSVKNKWIALFPKRKTSKLRRIFSQENSKITLEKKLKKLHETRLAKGYWIPKTSVEGRKILMILAALRRGPRFSEAIARKTGLTIPEIEIIIEKAKEWSWISEKLYLTAAGKGQLSHARKIKSSIVQCQKNSEKIYFPKLLRAPQIASS
ncbi:hypothetical protein FLL45_19815 [Aliikangiella marina]|uniref:Uncharacterized protein n=1 Tax=Aliikangiella marina TaxID=1712262 RepID=A0A545T2J0_9GAMM|nr:hypothetical protein [Aliikangiella marina]TQV71405.1 hypothetical protein FLL45_19815 [Aliikangiella marina]